MHKYIENVYVKFKNIFFFKFTLFKAFYKFELSLLNLNWLSEYELPIMILDNLVIQFQLYLK